MAQEGASSSDARQVEQTSPDDQDEWEYEYSTTETETYYLSIELSHPEFRGPVKTPNPGRAQYHKQWHESTNAAHAKVVGATAAAKAKECQHKQDGDEPMRDQDYDQDAPGEIAETMLDPRLRPGIPVVPSQSRARNATREPDDADEAAVEDDASEQQTDEDDGATSPAQDVAEDHAEPEMSHDIQILDLHSDKPYISYRGKVFEGGWAEVMGTELILSQHEQNDSFPVLRRLAQGVDLLAASSSRITAKEKIPKPKDVDDDDLADIKDEWNIKVPAGKDKTGERARQARFLESLMALKKKKGQDDQVTVFATRVDEQDFADDANPDHKPQRKKRPAERRQGTQPPDGARSQSSNPFAGRRISSGRTPRGGRGLIDSLSAVSRPTPRTLDEMNRDSRERAASRPQRTPDRQLAEEADTMDMSPVS